MANSAITVTKLERCPDNSIGPVARFGATKAEQLRVQELCTTLLRDLVSDTKDMYLLEWKGKKIPQGAVVSGKILAWTQNGLATSTHFQRIGSYKRLVESDGPNQDEHKMIIFVD